MGLFLRFLKGVVIIEHYQGRSVKTLNIYDMQSIQKDRARDAASAALGAWAIWSFI